MSALVTETNAGNELPQERTVMVVQTDDKGRALEARMDLNPGQVVVKDAAFVLASWDEDVCVVCRKSHESSRCKRVKELFGTKLAKSLLDIEDALCEVDEVGELDRARTVLLCLFKPKDALSSAFQNMTVANEERARLAAQEIVSEIPAMKRLLKEKNISTDILAKIIGVLNTNCHTLENLGGSGLFPFACICEHSCAPTCNFTSDGDTIQIIPLVSIAKGERISLDYLNLFYEPTADRQEALLSSYGFTCTCPKCSGQLPDKARAFVCPNNDQHFVCPFGSGASNIFKCLDPTCGFIASAEQVAQFKTAETNSGENTCSHLLKKEHHLKFYPLAEVAHAEAKGSPNPENTIQSWRQVIECIDYCLPEFHYERALHYDKFGQVLFRYGSKEEAREAFRKAFEISTICEGPPERATLTRQLKSLVDNMPQTLEELVAHYSKQA